MTSYELEINFIIYLKWQLRATLFVLTSQSLTQSDIGTRQLPRQFLKAIYLRYFMIFIINDKESKELYKFYWNIDFTL